MLPFEHCSLRMEVRCLNALRRLRPECTVLCQPWKAHAANGSLIAGVTFGAAIRCAQQTLPQKSGVRLAGTTTWRSFTTRPWALHILLTRWGSYYRWSLCSRTSTNRRCVQ